MHRRRGASKIWIQMDVDAHRGQTDAGRVAEALRQIFPGCYVETRPSGTAATCISGSRVSPATSASTTR